MNKQIPKKKRDNNEEKSPAFLHLQQMSTEGVSYGTKTQSQTFHSPMPARYHMMSAKQLKTERTQNSRQIKFKLDAAGNNNSNVNVQESHSSYGKCAQPQPASNGGNDTKRRLE